MKPDIRVLTLSCVLLAGSSLQAGLVAGQVADLNGSLIDDRTVTIDVRTARGNRRVGSGSTTTGVFSVPINDALLSPDDKDVTVFFTAPGRQDATIRQLLGDASHTVAVVQPEKKMYGQPQTCNGYRRRGLLHRR